jgi:HK97 family phage major capsid protein
MQEPSAVATMGWAARALAIASKSYAGAAENWLIDNRAPQKAQQIFKAAISASNTTDSDLGDYGISIGQWTDSLRTRSAFFRLLADNAFTRVPMRTRVGLATSTASGAIVPEGEAVPVSRVTLDNVLLLPVKASALITVTDTLLRDVSAAGQALFNRELMSAVSDAVDAAFVDSILSTGITSNPSAGVSAVNAKHDLRTALLAVNTIGAARLYWLASVDVAKKAAALADSAGGDAFPAMSPTGGELTALPCIVSSGLPDGTLLLLDASGIAADAAQVSVDLSRQATIRMDTAPVMSSVVPTAAQMTSMFQTNSAALLASAWFGAQVLRDDALAMVTSINWGG